MSDCCLLPKGTDLIRAVKYIGEHHCHDARSLNGVAFRFDLNPLDQQFILEHFIEPSDPINAKSNQSK
ncbi:hypothetical protein SNR37_000437 [Agarivorans aestuarii]|uniref:PilZ domain-containing protein n=1 Tax=Agarivorans aestuarii TaxID=1563703 RepID=A0ABU7G9I1_9ALTE|nr:hypothetical protein [Agarivorans aestuarii]MEE1675115.1 hypothetical protein [Agarivorans aestuarii]